MCTSKVLLSVLLGVGTIPLNAWADDLTMTVRTDKETYEFGEAIMLTVTVWNNSPQTYVLATTPFEHPARALLGTWPPPGERVGPLPEHYVGVIKSPGGRPVHSQREYGKHFLDRRPRTITLKSGGSHTVTYNLRDHYPPRSSTPGGTAFSLDETGTYELSAKYHLYYAHTWPDEYDGIFIGPIESNTVKFSVKVLGGARLAQLLEQLNEDDMDTKCEALSLLRRGGAVKQIPEGLLLQFLHEDQPRELRVQAAFAIYDAPDPNAWETFAEFLDDSHWTIRSMMAGALRKIGNKAAGDALYAVTDPEKYPRSYWGAFKALVQIGDPRAREVAARLAESAESPGLREMAAKFLRDGVLHDGTSVPTNHSESGQPLPDD